MSAYRDASEAHRQRHAQLRRLADRLAARLTPELARVLPARAGELQRLAREAELRQDGPGEWQRASAAAERYVEALEGLIAEAPELQEQLATPAAEIPRLAVDLWPPASWEFFWSAVAQEHQEELLRLCLAVDSRSRVVPPGDPARLAERDKVFEVHLRLVEAPICVHLALVSSDANNTHPGPTMLMVTTVGLAAPTLHLRPEMLRHSILLKPLGIVRDVEVGQFDFDGTFLIDGSERDARQLLTRRVRKGLLEVAHYEIPELRLGHGLALLKWRYEPNQPAFAGALEVLIGLREARIDLPLLHDEGHRREDGPSR